MGSRISVLIINWNGRKWLERCLRSILDQHISEDFEVVLVDNGSTDSSVNYVKRSFPKTKVVELDTNYGYAEGNNRGLKSARGDYLVFVNTDTEAKDGWLKNLVTAADEHQEYEILCSIQLPSQDRNRIRTLNAFGYPTINECQSKFAVTDSLFASGACFLIRREWLHRIGYLFDPNYFCFGEDLELSLRTILLGGRIGYVCDSRIYHHAGGSGFPNAKVSYFSTRNFLLTYYKLFELKNFARIFWVHIAYIMMARHKQMLKGLLGFFSSFYGYGNYRKAFAKNKKRSDKYILGRFLFVERMEKMILKRAIYGC